MNTIELAFVQEHLAEAGVVHGRPHESPAAGKPGRRLLELILRRSYGPVDGSVGAGRVERDQPVPLRLRDGKTRIDHSQRLEDACVEEPPTDHAAFCGYIEAAEPGIDQRE